MPDAKVQLDCNGNGIYYKVDHSDDNDHYGCFVQLKLVFHELTSKKNEEL